VQLHIGESGDSGFALRAPRNDSDQEFSMGGSIGLPPFRFGVSPWQSRMAIHDARMGRVTLPFASLFRRA
jgi:hypothetical protein